MDILESPPNTATISSDFGTGLTLRVKYTLNSRKDYHEICDIFVVNTKTQDVPYKELGPNGSFRWKIARIVNCDKWIVFGNSIIKGKMNDSITHTSNLDDVIDFYENENIEIEGEPYEQWIIHTDGSPSQYKNKKTFIM